MTTDEKRAFVSRLAGELYARPGITSDEAAVLAFSALEVFEAEWDAMTPEQRAARHAEASVNLSARR